MTKKDIKMKLLDLSRGIESVDSVMDFLEDNLVDIEEEPIKAIEFPAMLIAHTPSGAVMCCNKHAQQMTAVFGAMGCHVYIESAFETIGECVNCVNEHSKQGGE